MKNKTKYTPGPWRLHKTDNAIRRLTGAKTPKEIEANAQLIAAAPEMYEALRLTHLALIELNGKPPGEASLKTILVNTSKALAKARGES